MQQPIRYVPVCRVKRRNLLWKAARKGKEMKVIGTSFPWQRRENGQEALSPAELPFSGMSVIRIWKTAAREGAFFNRAGASFPVARFCGGNVTDNIRTFRLSLTGESSSQSLLDPFLLLHGKAVKMRRWQGNGQEFAWNLERQREIRSTGDAFFLPMTPLRDICP